MLDPDELFPSRDEPDEGMTAAIAAVCARLGRAIEVAGPGRARSTIVGGAIDGERVAWVEQRWQDAGYPDIEEYTLTMRAGDGRERAWIVETYNPWFGCEVYLLRWFGDEVVAVYREKHRTIVCTVGFTGAPRLRVIAFAWQIVGDVVLYASEARGLVERVRVPDLTVCTPIPIDEAARDLAAGTCESLEPLVPDGAALWSRIAARLPDVSGVTAELLIGALAYPFWDAPVPLSESYEDAYRRAHDRWNTPCWLPFYAYQALDAGTAEMLLAEFDAIAARAPAAYDPADAPAELAARHIAARCGELAAVCRAGRLPDGVSCHFWVEWSQEAFVAEEPLFPPGMWRVWQGLAPGARSRP